MELRVDNMNRNIIQDINIETYNPEQSYDILPKDNYSTRFSYDKQMSKQNRPKRPRNEKTPSKADPSPSRAPKRTKSSVQL